MSAVIEVAKWFGGAQRVLFVHAHPDDETISTGGTLAGLAEAGRTPLLITLTRGEQGEVNPGPFAGLQGTPGLAPHREAELTAALAMLGVEHHAFLGQPPARAEGLDARSYEDSGMQWSEPGLDGRSWAIAAPAAPAAALTRAPAVEALNDLLAFANELGAEAIVSYDENGGYGHPDHVFAHRAARAVAHGLELPFWQVEAGSADPTRMNARVSEADTEAEAQDHDVSPWLNRKVAALRAHSTQVTVDADEIVHEGVGHDVPELVHVGGQRHPIGTVERFRRLA